jgi:TIR domain
MRDDRGERDRHETVKGSTSLTDPDRTAMAASTLRVFLNYRREDTSGHAGRVYDSLAERFGSEHVFMDVDAIDPGADYTEVIEGAVGSCDVLIALIGRAWLSVSDAKGRHRSPR